MKRTIITASAALLFGLVLGFFLFRGHSPSGEAHDHGNASSGGDEGAAAEDEVWTCSMHPQVKAPKPGLCPICAMDLIPLSAMGGGDGERSFSMSEAAKALAGITTAEVVRDYPEAKIHLYGKIDHDETRMRSINARFPGRIEDLYVDYEGTRVRQDDELGVIYSPELLTAQSELLSAIRFGNSSAISIARDKLKLWGFSEGRIAEIEESGEASNTLVIDSPLSGIVTRKMVVEGSYVDTGDMMFMVADHSVVWLELAAYESDLAWIRYGQELTFTTKTHGDREFRGTIVFVDHELDPMTRTAKVRVNVDNPGMILKPGMFAHATVKARIAATGQVFDPSLSGKWISPMHPEIVKDGPGQCDVCGMDLVPAESLGYFPVEDQTKPPLVVPASSVLHTGKRSVVYVELLDTEQPTYEGREILVGPRAGDQYIVEAGLEAGERVVAEGGFVIDSALQIQAKPSMMLPGDAEGDRLFPEAPAPDEFLTETDELLESYFDLQQALANDSLTDAQKYAERIAARLGSISTDELPPPSMEVWRNLSDRIGETLARLRSREEIEPFRADFQSLTILVDELVRRFGTAHLPVYEHYCPMAFDDKGAFWLQANEDLRNPYFGSSMLQCGEVRAQITEAKARSLGGPSDMALREVVAGYLSIKKALSEDQFEKAREHLPMVEKSLAPLRENKDEAVSDLAGKIADRVALARQRKDIEALRLVFKEISGLMESLVVRFGAGLETPLYKAHCPMAFNNVGADWLQTGEEIRNPYFGASMLNCGEIKEQLVAPDGKAGKDSE